MGKLYYVYYYIIYFEFLEFDLDLLVLFFIFFFMEFLFFLLEEFVFGFLLLFNGLKRGLLKLVGFLIEG